MHNSQPASFKYSISTFRNSKPVMNKSNTVKAQGLIPSTAPAMIMRPEAPLKLGRPRKAKAVEAENDAPLQMIETQR